MINIEQIFAEDDVVSFQKLLRQLKIYEPSLSIKELYWIDFIENQIHTLSYYLIYSLKFPVKIFTKCFEYFNYNYLMECFMNKIHCEDGHNYWTRFIYITQRYQINIFSTIVDTCDVRQPLFLSAIANANFFFLNYFMRLISDNPDHQFSIGQRPQNPKFLRALELMIIKGRNHQTHSCLDVSTRRNFVIITNPELIMENFINDLFSYVSHHVQLYMQAKNSTTKIHKEYFLKSILTEKLIEVALKVGDYKSLKLILEFDLTIKIYKIENLRLTLKTLKNLSYADLIEYLTQFTDKIYPALGFAITVANSEVWYENFDYCKRLITTHLQKRSAAVSTLFGSSEHYLHCLNLARANQQEHHCPLI